MPNNERVSGNGSFNPHYSPKLCNEDLAPTRDQNWSWYNIFLSGCQMCTAWGLCGCRQLLRTRVIQLASVVMLTSRYLYCANLCQFGG